MTPQEAIHDSEVEINSIEMPELPEELKRRINIGNSPLFHQPENVTPNYYGAKCSCGAKMDPYTICDAYANENKGSAWHHATKKLLRAGDGHKPLEKDVKEVIDTLNRWLEQIQSNKDTDT